MDVNVLARRTLSLAVILAVWVPAGWAAVRVSANGQPYSADAGEITFKPGAGNRLAVEVDPGSLAAQPLRATLIRESPSGERFSSDERLDRTHPRVEFIVGPLAAPPVFEYEAGMLYVRGYSLTLRILDDQGRAAAGWEFHQTLAKPETADHPYPWWQLDDAPARALRFTAGGDERAVYDLKSLVLGPLSLRLDEDVLDDQDKLRIQVRLNNGETPASMAAAIRVDGPAGVVWSAEATLTNTEGWRNFDLQPHSWALGEYHVKVLPRVDGTLWPDGPRVTYRRTQVNPLEVRVSPLAPWTLERDPQRKETIVTDARQVPKLSGYFAAFAKAAGAAGVFVQLGDHGLVRLVRPDRRGAGTFLEAADLTSQQIRTYANGHAGGSLVWIKLVPVTEVSVRAFYRETGHPPTPLFSINDWADNFGSNGSFRIQPDQIDLISCTQAELGSRTIGWSVGRSWVEYRSHLPQAKTFPCVPYEEAKKSPRYPRDDPYDYGPRIAMMNQYDPLEIVMESRRRCGVEVWPWLGMQRHYGVSFYGGLFACPFYRDNPRWWRSAKDGSHAAGVSFFFPEVRKERVDILLEVAGRGADGLVVGCDRQVPMLLYDSEMVEAYRARTGIDARKIDASSGKAYEDWIRWRAGFFTELLRDLQRGLEPVRAKTGKAIPVAIRFPSAGLFLNLAQGLDVEQWCREGLIDQMQLDPLEELAGKGRHDIRPYLDLGRRYGVAVIGGIGSTGYLGDPNKRPSHIVPGLKRALGLLRAGVDGIDTYETNGVALSYESRFIVPLFANAKRLEEFLRGSNLEASYPVDAGNAAAGHDNHSRWDRGWSVFGFAKNSY